MNEHTPHTEPLRIVADHMVVERSGELAIIDTGVPSSLPCPSVVTEVLGLPVARLIGCSELAEEPLEIDWPGRRLVRGAAPRPGAVAAPLIPTSFGVPRIAIATRAGTIQAVLDTGAALSYAPPEAVGDLTPIRRANDYLPGYGQFAVDVYRMEVAVAGVPMTIECGVLPPLLRMALALIAPDGWILGADLFRERVVRLDLAGSTIHLSPLGGTVGEDRDDPGDTLEHHPRASATAPDAGSLTRGRAAIECSVTIDAEHVAGRDVHLRAAVTLRGAGAESDHPMELALVIDRSGSMAGQRTRAVREAARTAVRQLPAGSSVGIISYNGSVTTDLPLSPAGDTTAAAVDRVLQAIQAGGSTALAAGWRAGHDLLATASADGGHPVAEPLSEPPAGRRALRRILLLSDGRANVGERSPATLAAWCAGAAAEGVTTSTVGIGAGYDEDLLRGMAVAGNGSTWYVATTDHATAVLEEELRAMRTVSLLGARLTLTPSSGVRPLAVHGGLATTLGAHLDAPQAYDPEDQVPREVPLGEISVAASRTVVVELLIPHELARQASEGTPLGLGIIHVLGTAPDGKTAATTTIELTWGGRVAPDATARREWLRLMVAAARLDAVRLADRGMHARAVARLHEVLALAEREPASVVEGLRAQMGDIQKLMARLARSEFTPAMRKMALQRADNILTGKAGYDGWLGR